MHFSISICLFIYSQTFNKKPHNMTSPVLCAGTIGVTICHVILGILLHVTDLPCPVYLIRKSF